MSPAGASSRRRQVLKFLAWSTLASLALVATLGWYITTDSFQEMVRRRLVTELERVTGGRVELGSFHTVPLRFRVEIRDLTIHGNEGPAEAPYAHVDRVTGEVKIISVLGAEFGFHSVVLDRPVIHLIFYPDGTSNQPTPKLNWVSRQLPIQQLFRLSISRLEIRRGALLWNEQTLPLDAVLSDVSADMTYSLLHRRYDGNILLGKVVTKLQDYRPFAWTLEGHFSLGANSIDLRSLKATSGRSRIEAAGRLANFRQPAIEATYHASVDLTEAAAVFRSPQLRRGAAQVQGGGTWSLSQFSSSGKFSVKDLDWRDRSLNLTGTSLSSAFSITQQRLSLSQLQAHLLGGEISGEADVSQWMALAITRPTKQKNGEGQKGTVALRVKDISVGAFASAVSTPEWPLQRMNVAANGSGTIGLRWKDSPRNAQAEVALDVVPTGPAVHGQLPLNARIRANYQADSGDLEIAELSASTRGSELRASGRLAESGVLKLSASTSDLGEWRPILAAFGHSEHIPILLQGRVAFNGAATGKLPNLALAGNLQIEDFDYQIPATARTSEQTVHWDSFTAGVQFSRHILSARNAVLRHGPAIIAFDFNAGLDHGQFTEQTPFSTRVDMRNADLAEVLSLAGYHYPVRGTGNLSLQASGTWMQLGGSGRMHLANVNAYGEDVQNINSDLRFTGDKVQFENLHAIYGDASVFGNAGASLSTGVFNFNLNGTNFDLARLPVIRNSQPGVEGGMDFSAQGAGTLQEPGIKATFRFRDLTFDAERAGDFTLEAASTGADVHLTGRSQFGAGEDLNLEGHINLRGDFSATIDAHFSQLDIDPLLRSYQRGRLTSHSRAAGEVHLQGPLRQPAELNLTANLTDLEAGIENIPLRNDGPIRFTISSQIARIEPFHLIGKDTDLTASGNVELSGGRRIDMHAQGNANLVLIESFNSDFASSGKAAVDMTVTGTISQPLVQGRVQVTNGAIAYADLPSALADINGSLIFSQNRLQVESVTAHTGGGLVTFGGYATWRNRQLNFDLTLKEQEVRLRYPPGVSSTADSNLRFLGSSAASTLSGDITVTKLSVTPGFDFGSYLARRARTSALPQTNPLLNSIRLDVRIVTVPELQMQTAVVRLSGDADLRVRGTAARPVILGRADVLEGQVYFNGTKYELERGEVAFTSPVTTTPVLDLQATTSVRDYDITLNLTGEPGSDKFKVNYRSEPPLPEADIIALLALGRTTEESAQLQQNGQSSFTEEASSAIINQALNAAVTNRMQRLFGVSRIKIDPEGLESETNLTHGPLVTIEQQVANNLTITYSTSVEQASQQIIQVEYNLPHNISIVALRDQNGVVSFDVRVRRRKK